MDCLLSQKHVDGYVDGELSPSAMFEFEGHLAGCEECRAQVEFSRRLKRSLRSGFAAASAPEGLQLRVSRTLEAEARGGRGPLRSRQGAGMAAMAAAATALMYISGGQWPLSGLQSSFGFHQQAGLTAMPVFGDIVERHRSHTGSIAPVEEPEREVRRVGDNLGMRIQTVPFDSPQVRLRGARLSHVGQYRAAELYYSVGNKWLTAVVFEATPEIRGLLEREPMIRHERVGDREISYYSVKGYTVPILEHEGLIYSFTGDLNRSELLQVVGSARLP